jgi:hypothetical protein
VESSEISFARSIAAGATSDELNKKNTTCGERRMDNATQAALEESIAKWEGIVAGTETDHGPRNCGLCRLYLDANCFGCPVAKQTGTGGCRSTPYRCYCDLRADQGERHPDTIAAAREEVAFLKGLRVPFNLEQEDSRAVADLTITL